MRRLAVTQSLVVNPKSCQVSLQEPDMALCYVYPELLTPETRGHGCQFHHSTKLRECKNAKTNFI